MAGRQHHAGTSLRVRTGDGAVVVVRVEGRLAGGPGRLTIEDRANTRGLALHTRRAGGPVEGLEVELVRTGLFGDEASTGLALLPDDRGTPVWLRAPERSDAGRILTGVVEGLAAPELPLEARLWHAHRTREPGGEVERLAATWQGPGAEDPWHTELHVAHHVDAGTTEFLAVDGSTDQAWTLADAVHTPGMPLAWRVHPAPRPDEASRAGEALYSLIVAFAGALKG